MAFYLSSPNWPDLIYQFEQTDVVEGGPNGIDNKPLKELADRTQWLRSALRGFLDVTSVTASRALTKDEVLQKFILIDGNGGASITVTLPQLEEEDKGTVVTLAGFNISKQATVQVGNPIYLANASKTKVFLGAGDKIELLYAHPGWLLVDFAGNLFDVGDFDFGYNQKPNTVVANGDLLSRADYPRLWDWVQTYLGGGVSDITWSNTANMRGFFSSGNGTTNFRVPDLRGMFIRGLDYGRGISLGRNSTSPGGYEDDEFESHIHTFAKRGDRALDIASTQGIVETNYDQPSGSANGNYTTTMNAAGGLETRPKNIGLIPLIKV